MLQKILHSLGLSEKEIQVYEAALELGPSTLQEISQKAGILRTSGYTYIRGLREKRTYE